MNNSKTMKIVRYMRTHTGITQMDAYDLCKATRLGSIIFDLKKRGYDIETIYYRTDNTRYAEYRLSHKYKRYMNYLDSWYRNHDEGAPACYDEWLDNEGAE